MKIVWIQSVIAHRMPREHFQWSFKFHRKTNKICFCEEITSCREIGGRFAGIYM